MPPIHARWLALSATWLIIYTRCVPVSCFYFLFLFSLSSAMQCCFCCFLFFWINEISTIFALFAWCRLRIFADSFLLWIQRKKRPQLYKQPNEPNINVYKRRRSVHVLIVAYSINGFFSVGYLFVNFGHISAQNQKNSSENDCNIRIFFPTQ